MPGQLAVMRTLTGRSVAATLVAGLLVAGCSRPADPPTQGVPQRRTEESFSRRANAKPTTRPPSEIAPVWTDAIPSEPEPRPAQPNIPEPVASPPGKSTAAPAKPEGPAGEPSPEQQDRALRAEQLEAARRLVATLPKSDNALYLTALVYREQGDVQQAADYCHKALQLNPRRAEAYGVLGHIALLRGDYPQVVELSRQALAVDPKVPGVAFRLAQALIRLGKIPEAISALEKDLENSPPASQCYRALGECHLQLQQYANAMRYFEKAIEIQPELAEAHYGLATVSARLGQKDKAAEHRQRFKTLATEKQNVGRRQRSEFNPLEITRRSTAHTHTDVARVYRRSGYLWAAEKLWRRAAELDPRNTACRSQLVSIYRQNNKLLEALELCEQIRAAEPDNSLNHLTIGVLSGQLKRTAAATAAFEKVIELAPSRAEGYHALARHYLQTDQELARAQTLATKAVELDPIAPNYFVLGEACDRNGDPQAGLDALQKAVELDPRNATYQRALRKLEGTK